MISSRCWNSSPPTGSNVVSQFPFLEVILHDFHANYGIIARFCRVGTWIRAQQFDTDSSSGLFSATSILQSPFQPLLGLP